MIATRAQIYPDLTLPEYHYPGCGERRTTDKKIGEKIRAAIEANPEATYTEIGSMVNRSANQISLFARRMGFPKRSPGRQK